MFDFKRLPEPRLTYPQFRMVQDHFLNMSNAEMSAAFGMTPDYFARLRAEAEPITGLLITALWLYLYEGVPAWSPDNVESN